MDWLFNQLPNYQTQGTSAYKPGLDTIEKFLKGIGDPQNNFKSVHIAGTNGKGSVAHMMAAVYQKNGYKTGIFTSPHISDFRERIKLNGSYIPVEKVISFLRENFDLICDLKATFFEITTAMAIDYFSDEKVDIAIIETGLGGRLDASNVLLPQLSIITSISKDHTQFLGDDITSIAFEKAGIIKNNTAVVIGKLHPEAETVVKDVASSKNAEVIKAKPVEFKSDLVASYQKDNLQIAVAAINAIQNQFPVEEEKMQKGLLDVTHLTKFYGRFQRIKQNPDIIVDVAHNEAGVKALLNEVQHTDCAHLHIVYGTSSDKDIKSIIRLFPTDAQYYFTEFESPRSLKADQFNLFAEEFNLKSEVFHNPESAVEKAKTNANPNDLILVFGSIYLMDSILKLHE